MQIWGISNLGEKFLILNEIQRLMVEATLNSMGTRLNSARKAMLGKFMEALWRKLKTFVKWAQISSFDD